MLFRSAAPFVSTTVHLTFPLRIGAMLHHIMEHTAHHVDMSIPLYQLEGVQRMLEDALPGRIIVQRFSWRWYFDTARRCKLYGRKKYGDCVLAGRRRLPCSQVEVGKVGRLRVGGRLGQGRHRRRPRRGRHREQLGHRPREGSRGERRLRAHGRWSNDERPRRRRVGL